MTRDGFDDRPADHETRPSVANGDGSRTTDGSPAIRIPRGELVRSRVVSDSATVLATALDRRLTGYVVLQPQETLLLDNDAAGVITFDDGVPVLAYHTNTDRGGAPALADLAEPGPLRADLYELPAEALVRAHETSDLQVPPGMAAERLGGDPDLADRTREHAPADRLDSDDTVDPVVSFLEDEAKIDAIREQAREQARERADEWGFTDELAGD